MKQANTNAPAIMIAERAADLIRFGSSFSYAGGPSKHEITYNDIDGTYDNGDYEDDYDDYHHHHQHPHHHHYYRRSLGEEAPSISEWSIRNETDGHDYLWHRMVVEEQNNG